MSLPKAPRLLPNGKTYFTFSCEHKTRQQWPFAQPFYKILNLAIGDTWGGKNGINENSFSATPEVDEVRVYQKQ